jgi:hypothetical protein
LKQFRALLHRTQGAVDHPLQSLLIVLDSGSHFNETILLTKALSLNRAK